MRKDKTVTIDKHKFLITMLDPESALKVLIWLVKSVGGSLSKSLGAFDSIEKVLDGDFGMGNLGDALSNLFEKMDEKETIEKIEILLNCVSNDGSDLNLQSPMFYGETFLILKVVKESMEVNFKSFLDEISGVLGRVKEKIQGESTIEGAK